MTLTELVRRNDWISVRAILLKIYPEEVKSRDAYREAYQELQATKAVQCDTVI